MWTEFVTVFAVLIAGIAMVAVVAPKLFIDQLESLDLPSKIWVLAAIRLAMGAGLWIVAPETEHPTVFRVFGVITVCAAIALPLLGTKGVTRVIEWWMEKPPAVLRAWGVLAMGFALYLLWSLHSN